MKAVGEFLLNILLGFLTVAVVLIIAAGAVLCFVMVAKVPGWAAVTLGLTGIFLAVIAVFQLRVIGASYWTYHD